MKCDTTNYLSIASIYVPHYEGDMGGDMLEHGDMKFSVSWSKKYAGQKFILYMCGIGESLLLYHEASV